MSQAREQVIGKLKFLTTTTGRDHRTGEEFVHGQGSQTIVDVMRAALALLQQEQPASLNRREGMTEETKTPAPRSHVMVTDEMVKRFADVYYGGGVPHLTTDIRYALSFAINGERPVEAVIEKSFTIEWIAASRPPVHPTPMTGRHTFRSFDRAVQHMRSQADDAQFVSLTEHTLTTVTVDRSSDLRAALASAEVEG